MKLTVVTTLVLCVVALPAAGQVPVGDAINYQGSLTDQGSLANGQYDFEFVLYDAETGGNALGSVFQADNVDVVEGLFTVDLSFGPDLFHIYSVWIEISVREGSSTGAYTPLNPRQKVTPAPVAHRAVTGVGPIHGLNVDANGSVGIGTSGQGEALHVIGEARVSDKLHVGLSSITIDDGTDSITASGGTLNFSNTNLWTLGTLGVGTNNPLGQIHVTSDFDPAISFENNGDTSVFRRVSLNLRHDNGIGAEIEARRETGDDDGMSLAFKTEPIGGTVTERMRITPDGQVGIATASPDTPLHVYGENQDFVPPSVVRIESRQTPSVFDFHYATELSGNSINTYEDGSNDGITLTIQGESDGDVQLVRGGGQVGVNGVPQSRFHVHGSDLVSPISSALSFEEIVISDNLPWLGLYDEDDGNVGGGISFGSVIGGGASVDKWAIYRRTTGNEGDLVITYGTDPNPTANEKIAQFMPDGTTKVKVIEITGADVAERFPVSERVEPGMVVEIDPERIGQMRQAKGAYNRRVAGVVSGAGDLPVGAILGNLTDKDDGPPIALSGRVWVFCDATEHAIQPGDLLTTADRAGHAMKVIDHGRATGATIGKAMSRLAHGKTGLVLVLINLQ